MQFSAEGLQNLTWFMGIVEDREDPTHHGRVRVRAFGFHPPLNTNEVLTEDLPWAFMINGTGGAFFSIPEEGDWVFGFFMDGRDAQHPYVLGVIHGAHNTIPYDGFVGDSFEQQFDPTSRADSNLSRPASGPTPGYPADMSQEEIETIIREESILRGIDPNVAIRIYRAEGAGGYQSGISRSGGGSLNGREASFGPYQLYTGGGLGNEYEQNTGRKLTSDNTREGITKQIQFSLDAATRSGGWQPWYGRGPAGVGKYDGLSGATPINNWRNERS